MSDKLPDELKAAMGEYPARDIVQWARRNVDCEEATMRRLNARSPGYETAYNALRRWQSVARTYELIARLQSGDRRKVTTA